MILSLCVWIIPFPVWTTSFSVWKINFEVFGSNEKYFVKEIFWSRGLEVEEMISFPVLIIPFPVVNIDFELLRVVEEGRNTSIPCFVNSISCFENQLEQNQKILPKMSHFRPKSEKITWLGIFLVNWTLIKWLKIWAEYSSFEIERSKSPRKSPPSLPGRIPD